MKKVDQMMSEQKKNVHITFNHLKELIVSQQLNQNYTNQIRAEMNYAHIYILQATCT